MKNEELKIECPHCQWEPDGKPHWFCSKCSNNWDTFSTFAKCPACRYVHRYTQCIRCSVISEHYKWYKNLDGPSVEELLKEEPISALFK